RAILHTLPTGPWILAAGAAVALSAAVLALSGRVPSPRTVDLCRCRPAAVDAGSWLGAGALILLVAAGYLGSRDPFGNPLTLTVWIVVWVGLTLAVAVFGDLWRVVSPWRA